MYFVHEGGSGGGEVWLRTHQAAAGAQVCFFLMLSPFLLLIGRVPSTVRWPRGRQAGSRRESVGNTGGSGGGGGVKVTSAPCSDLEENNVAGPSAVEETLSPDLPRCNRDCNARQCMASAGAVATDRHRPLPSGVEPRGC